MSAMVGRTWREAVAVEPAVALETAVFLPAGDGPFPAEVLRTPYGIDDRVADAERMTADGVAVVVQNVRGRFGSDGEFDLGRSDGDDGAATVAWITAQPWSDGRVALWGFSYGGFTQWATLAAGAGAVAACPSMCPPPGRRLDFRRSGAIEWAALAHWLPRQAAIGGRASPGEAAALLAAAFEPSQVEGPGGDIETARALGHPVVGSHPQRSAWPGGDSVEATLWRQVFDEAPPTHPRALPPISTPCLVVGSWYDLWSEEPGHAFAAVRAASVDAEVAASHRLILAAAGHGFHPLEGLDLGADAGRFGLDLDHRWAQEWLTGTVGPLRSLAPVTWFLIGPNVWRSAPSWPPPSAIEEVVPLGRAGADASTFAAHPAEPVPTRGGSGMLLAPGPRSQTGLSAADRDDVASFDVPLAGDGRPDADGPVVLAGPVVADLFVSVDAPDADIAAKLVDVGPDGTARSVCDGIVRLRWRGGDGVARLLDAGEVVAVTVRLGAIGYEVAAGHRLRLDVAGSNFPRYALNAHTGAAEGTDGPDDLRPATISVHHSTTHPSTVTLTVLPGAQQ